MDLIKQPIFFCGNVYLLHLFKEDSNLNEKVGVDKIGGKISLNQKQIFLWCWRYHVDEYKTIYP